MNKIMCSTETGEKICSKCQSVAIYSPIVWIMVKFYGCCWKYCPRCGGKLKVLKKDENREKRLKKST